MFIYGDIKSFFTKTIIGAFLITLSIFFLVFLFTHNSADPGFGIVSSYKEVANYGGIYGAYTSSFFFATIGYSSYLFPVFLLANGTKFILGIKNKNILFKFFLLILGALLLSINLALVYVDNSLIGNFFSDLIKIKFDQYLKINFIFFVFITVLIIVSIVFIFYGIGIKLNIKILSIFKFLKIFKFFIKGFNVLKTLLPAKYPSYKIRKKIIGRGLGKSEPTIHRSRNSINQKTSIKKDYSTSMQYKLPAVSLLNLSSEKSSLSKEIEKRNSEYSKKLEIILREYGVEGKIINYKYGPVVTLYEFLPAAGVKTSKVVGLSNDIARAMSSLSTRISSQPGKTSIGIEIPNLKREGVLLGDLINDYNFSSNEEGLRLALGKNISGEKIFADLEKMPHLLIAGTTGSGKSVGINSMIISLLFRFTPSECKLILIDPKMLELSIYADIPHLLTPVVTNPNKAVFALKWVVREMENRYRLMSSLNVKNIKSFNNKILSAQSSGRKLYREVQTGFDKDTRMPILEKKEIPLEKMPLIVVVIDEMADLMMVAGKEVESLVQRLAQMARASGIHLIAATQRPSVDVITGTIKANFPSRISFKVASRFDSRTIINEMGAEQLLGSGDMLFLENGASLTRLHGGYISENEIEAVVKHIKLQTGNITPQDITEEKAILDNSLNLGFSNKDVDELYQKALSIVIEQQKVSTSFIQRYLQIGYNRAARIVEKMEDDGYISEASHAGKRSVLKKNI